MLLWEVPRRTSLRFPFPNFKRLEAAPGARTSNPKKGEFVAPSAPVPSLPRLGETQRFSLLAFRALPAPKRRWGSRFGAPSLRKPKAGCSVRQSAPTPRPFSASGRGFSHCREPGLVKKKRKFSAKGDFSRKNVSDSGISRRAWRAGSPGATGARWDPPKFGGCCPRHPPARAAPPPPGNSTYCQGFPAQECFRISVLSRGWEAPTADFPKAFAVQT